MPGKTQTHTDAVLNVLRNTSITGVNPFAGLFSTAPANDNDPGVELSGNGYARQSITFSAPTTDAGNVRRISNTNTIVFGPATANWPTAVAFGIFSASTGGTLLYWDNFQTPRTVPAGDSAEFKPNTLVVKED